MRMRRKYKAQHLNLISGAGVKWAQSHFFWSPNRIIVFSHLLSSTCGLVFVEHHKVGSLILKSRGGGALTNKMFSCEHLCLKPNLKSMIYKRIILICSRFHLSFYCKLSDMSKDKTDFYATNISLFFSFLFL